MPLLLIVEPSRLYHASTSSIIASKHTVLRSQIKLETCRSRKLPPQRNSDKDHPQDIHRAPNSTLVGVVVLLTLIGLTCHLNVICRKPYNIFCFALHHLLRSFGFTPEIYSSSVKAKILFQDVSSYLSTMKIVVSYCSSA